MIHWKFLAAPVISCFIGWVTNYIAVKMLFHPRKKINLGIISIQGIFPKRQKELAENLGEVIQKELISHNDFNNVVDNQEFHDKIKNLVEDYFVKFIKDKAIDINPMLPMFLNQEVINKIKYLVGVEFEKFLPEIIETIKFQVESTLNTKDLVKKKVEELSFDKLEDILFTIMKKEFRFIEIIGGVLGFLIGIIQSALFYFF
ncbi:MAG: DUF445 family protein [Candidatus Muirbacterium halophilum]|nr:DUF445 family protein [Candidatus Muirbacterium halophilum]MCK9474502.1 DUF445 family protein [Candidatus Muirbacterium halophilum]